MANYIKSKAGMINKVTPLFLLSKPSRKILSIQMGQFYLSNFKIQPHLLRKVASTIGITTLNTAREISMTSKTLITVMVAQMIIKFLLLYVTSVKSSNTGLPMPTLMASALIQLSIWTSARLATLSR